MASIIRWNPASRNMLREVAAMQNLVDRMFEDTWRGVRPTDELEGEMLALDVHENEADYTVVTSLPGVDAENININLQDDMLTIEAEIPEKVTETEKGKALLKERTYGKFSRRIRLPHAIKAENVEAAYKDGVLTLTLPKAENAMPRNIKVRRIDTVEG